MNTNGASHEHVLRPLGNLPIYLQQVRSLQSFEAEEVIFEVAGVVDNFIYALKVVFDDSVDIFGEKWSWSALLVMIVEQRVGNSQYAAVGTIVQRLYCDSIGEFSIVRVDDGHVGAGFCGQVCDFLSRHS